MHANCMLHDGMHAPFISHVVADAACQLIARLAVADACEVGAMRSLPQ
jgi:hypothetical protein